MDDRTALLTLLKQRLTTLIDAMPAAQAGDMRSVHQARVATRRLREALPVIGASVGTRALGRVGRQVRRMTRALGPVRELDVALANIDELAPRDIVSTRALARVRQSLARERLSRRREMLAAITPGKVEKLRQRIGQVSDSPQAPQTAAALDESEHQIGKRAQMLVTAIERAGGLYLPDRLHNVRIAAKKLRYALEIERELKRSRATARITQLKRVQDLLGRMHDFEILIDRTRQVQAEVAATDRKLATELDRLVRQLEEECRTNHALYMRRRAGLLKLCEAVIPPEADQGVAVA
ncbi:MAG TPA: CHAD domain-containing protein [Vicinamibacterales bacterium]|nr:CHAD domain-containing protein [Vicinamibacterales bacterium]